MTAKSGKESFEKNLKRLEEIVSNIEAGEDSLEQTLKYFEEGMKIAKKCQKFLEEAESKINKLVELGDGEIAEEPFEEE